VTTTAQDGPLTLSRRRLADAVAALADPTPVCIGGGVYRWSGSLYGRLREALAGGAVLTRGARWSRLLPCRLDVLMLLIEIDTTVGGWEPHGKTTIERLHELAARGWRPQDCELIDGYCGRLQHWALTVAELLAPAVRVFLEMPCPRCRARFTYRRDDFGESVRMRALRVGEEGCRCGACGASWEPRQFHWLARLLGCPALPA
jgi:hypothetical protein